MNRPVTRIPLASAIAIQAALDSEDHHLARIRPQTEPSLDEDLLDEGLFNSGTACQLAGGISRMTLWRWRAAGIIPEPIVIRGRNYWRRREFLAALARAGPAGQDAEGCGHE